MKLDMVYAMFEKVMREQAEKEADMLAEFETQLQVLREEFESTKRVSDILIGDLNRNINELNEQNKVLKQEQAQMKEANDMLVAENEQKVKEQVDLVQPASRNE